MDSTYFFHFIDVIAVFPLLLYLVDEALENRKTALMALAVMLNAMINYYFFFSTSVFFLIYLAFRILSSNKACSSKDGIRCIIYYALGALAAMFILMPSALSLLETHKATNSFSSTVSYENQTKKSITNKFIQEAMTDFFRQSLDVYFIEHRAEALRIAEQVLLNKRSREHAEKARTNMKKKLTGNIDITNRIAKFVDCRSKDLTKREVYIVEGDSALGSCKMGRDSEFQAIMPVRGKILNCLKADFTKIFKSEIITDLVKVLGCGVEVKSKHNKDINSFNIENLRWAKIIICTDADVDGFQIRTLILTMIYALMPTLIEEGKVFIAESPLFEITYKDETYFAYSEKEKVEILEKLEGKKVKIQRSKGLGENQADMMWQTTMNPETRRLIQVTPEDAEETAQVFELLLGDNLQGRKDYIAQHGKDYLDMIDVS